MNKGIVHVTPHATTVLLTGFGPFPGAQVNASARFSNALAKLASRRFPEAHIIHAVLPTQWTGAPETMDRLREQNHVDVILHFGVSKNAQGFVIEQMAHNQCDDCPDECGAPPRATHVNDNAPAQLRATFPSRDIERELTARNIPAQLSENAGAYLCNAVLFHSLFAARAPNTPRSAIGFVHIPQDLGTRVCPLSWRLALTGGLHIVNACLRQHAPK